MKILKTVIYIVTIFVLISCIPKEVSMENTRVNLKLINSIDLNGIIDEKPFWTVTEDRVFLASRGEVSIKSIDHAGILINEIDRIGMGPGELKGLMQPIINDVAKEIYYSDWEQGRDNCFDYDLNYKYSKPSSLKRVMYEHHYHDRSFILYEEYVKSDGKYMHNYLADLVINASVQTLKKVGFNRMGCIDIAIQLDGVSNSERIFVGIGSTEEIIIDIFDLEGNIINRINYPHPKVMREEEQLEQIEEKIANGKDFRNYKHNCAISSLGADNKNRIWVLNFAQTGNRNLMTFTESGELLNNIDLETANCDIKILNDKMYKIVWDDDDMYSLEIYQIEG